MKYKFKIYANELPGFIDSFKNPLSRFTFEGKILQIRRFNRKNDKGGGGEKNKCKRGRKQKLKNDDENEEVKISKESEGRSIAINTDSSKQSAQIQWVAIL